MKDRDRVLLQMAQMAYRLIEWLENQVHAPAQPNTLEWKAKLKKFLES